MRRQQEKQTESGLSVELEVPPSNNRSCDKFRWYLERLVDLLRYLWRRHSTVKAVILSVVKLAETLTVCFPLYANGNVTHLRISVLVAKLMKELVWSFPKLLHKQTRLIWKRYMR